MGTSAKAGIVLFALPQENTARRKHIIETTSFHCKGELRSKLIYKYVHQGMNQQII